MRDENAHAADLEELRLGRDGQKVAVAPDGVDGQVRKALFEKRYVPLPVAEVDDRVGPELRDRVEHFLCAAVGIGKDRKLHR